MSTALTLLRPSTETSWPIAPPRDSWRALGRRIDGRRPERRLVQTLLVVATCALILSCAAAGTLVATYQGRLERDAARSPIPMAETTPGAGRFVPISDSVGTQWVDVFAIEPGPDADLPPGLSSWPAPGEVVLSPALEGTAAGDVIIRRYGHISPHVIAVEGLASPTEPVAYVRPATGTLLSGRGYAVTSYGFPEDPTPLSDGQWGGALRQLPIAIPLGTILVFLVIPALILMRVAVRAGSGRRDRQLQLLTILGASRRQRRSYLTGSMGTPMLLGAVLAGAVLLALLLIDVRIPVVDYVLRAHDMRHGVLLVLAGAALGSALVVVTARRSNRVRPALSATRPRAAGFSERWWKLALLPAVCFAFVTGFSWSVQYTDTYARTLFVYAGIAGIALTLPSFIGSLGAVAARGMIGLGVKQGSAGWIIAGRRLLSEPRGARRLTAGIALVIVLAGHAMVLGTVTNSSEQAAQRLDHLVHGSVAVVDWTPDPRSQAALADTLDGSTQYVGILTPDPIGHPGDVQIIAACPALVTLGLSCEPQAVSPQQLPAGERLDFFRALEYITQVAIVPMDPLSVDSSGDDGAQYTLYAMTADGSAFPFEEIRTDLAHQVVPAPAVTDVAASWELGTQQQIDIFAWLPLFAGAAVLMLMTAILGALLGDTSVHADQAAVTRMWSPPRSFAIAIASGTVLVPALLAILVAVVATVWTTFPLTMPPIDGTLPRGFWTVTIAAPVALALVLTAAAAVLQQRRIVAWMPSKE